MIGINKRRTCVIGSQPVVSQSQVSEPLILLVKPLLCESQLNFVVPKSGLEYYFSQTSRVIGCVYLLALEKRSKTDYQICCTRDWAGIESLRSSAH